MFSLTTVSQRSDSAPAARFPTGGQKQKCVFFFCQELDEYLGDLQKLCCLATAGLELRSRGVPSHRITALRSWKFDVIIHMCRRGMAAPDGPDAPDSPEGPEAPDGPDGLDGPDGPDAPDSPEGPDGADAPEGPDTPEGPDSPDAPDAPCLVWTVSTS